MHEQARVAAFVDEHDLAAPPAYRLLDLTAEVGELASAATESTSYGRRPEEMTVDADEVGDVLFALLALAEGLEIDAGEALTTAIEKYDSRLAEHGTPASRTEDPSGKAS